MPFSFIKKVRKVFDRLIKFSSINSKLFPQFLNPFLFSDSAIPHFIKFLTFLSYKTLKFIRSSISSEGFSVCQLQFKIIFTWIIFVSWIFFSEEWTFRKNESWIAVEKSKEWFKDGRHLWSTSGFELPHIKRNSIFIIQINC